MSLANCFAKAGKALSGQDRSAIESLVEQGLSEMDAVMQHLESIDQGIDAIALSVEQQGGEVSRLEQTTSLRRGKETLKRFGLDPKKKHNTRDVAAALEDRQRKKFGTIERGDYSDKASRRIANWMVEEVLFEVEQAELNPEKSAVGWYSEKYQRALDVLGEAFPEFTGDIDVSLPGLAKLRTRDNARDFFTALMAVTSDGAKVADNFRFASTVYEGFRQTGTIDTNISWGADRNASMRINLKNIDDFLEQYGADKMREVLMHKETVQELSKIAKEQGISFSSDYKVTMRLPYAALIFGPKLGAFYANLMGDTGYLTMDRWWSRTFNRYRGNLLTQPTVEGLARFKELLTKDKRLNEYPSMISDEAAALATVEYALSYKRKGFKNGTEIEKAANTIYKAAFVETEDTPFNASDREFMINTAIKAQKSLARKGVTLTVADVQAVLWYYEKRLYAQMGARATKDVSYEEIARKVAESRAAARDAGLVGPDDESAGEAGSQTSLNPVDSEELSTRELAEDAEDTGFLEEPASGIRRFEQAGAAQRSSLGLYSAVEQAVLDMSLPAWKEKKGGSWPSHTPPGPSPTATGRDIWAKLSKSSVKKEELTLLGLEEILTSDPEQKFSRDDVATIVRENGVKLEEVNADRTLSEEFLEWGDMKTWDEPEAWEDMVENALYEFDAGEQEYSFGSIYDFMTQWTVRNYKEVVSNYESSLTADQLEDITSISDGHEVLDMLEGWGYEPREEMRQSAREEFEEKARQAAKKSYYEEPMEIYAGTAARTNDEDPNIIYIFGNDTMGWGVRPNAWQSYQNEIGHFDTYDEAKEAAKEFANENDWLVAPDDVNVARHENEGWQMEGDYTNYREKKLTLPELEADFYKPEHFPDRNVVANSRVTDRQLSTGDGSGPVNSYHGEEFQSDLHQTGREKGYADNSVDPDALEEQAMAVLKEQEKLWLPYFLGRAGTNVDVPSNHMTKSEFHSFVQLFAANGWEDASHGGVIQGSALVNRVHAYVDSFHPDMANVVDAIPAENWPKIKDNIQEYVSLNEKAALARNGAPDAPFRGKLAWESLLLKRSIIDAVENGYDAISWGNSGVLKARWPSVEGEIFVNLYDKKLPSLIKKITGSVGVPIAAQQMTPEGKPWESQAIDTTEWRALPSGMGDSVGTKLFEVSDARGISLGMFTVSENETAADAIEQARLLEETQRTDNQGYWIIPLTPELKAAVRAKGFAYFQQKPKPRGFYDPARNRIVLTERQNLSTFLHESGHQFLEMFREFAPMDESMQRDLSALEKWWAANGAVDEVRKHEIFASGFETFLMEGKAPTAALQPLFSRFRNWMVLVYKTLSGPFAENNLAGVELTDEIREVMGRMVASQEAIEAESSRQQYGPLPVEQLGLSPREASDYQVMVDAGEDEAVTQLTVQVMREMQRDRQTWWKDGVKEKAATAREELSAQAEYVLRDFLNGDISIEGVAPAKLSSEYIRLVYGKDAARKLQRMSSKDGVRPERFASTFGYRTGDEAVQALLGTMNKADRESYVQAQAVDQMRQEHGDMLVDGSLEQAAQEAVHNDRQADRLLTELRFLNRSAGKTQTPRQFFKAAAEKAVRETPINKLRPDIHRRNEIKARNAALKAAAKQDFDTAALEQHKAVRQFFMYQQSLKAKEQAGKIDARLAQMKKTKYSARDVNPNYLQALKVLLSAYDLRKNPKDSNDKLDQVHRFIAAQKKTNPDLIADDILDSITSWKDMTLGELSALKDAADNLLKIGKTEGAANREAIKEQAASLAANVLTKMGKPARVHTDRSRVDQFRKGVAQFGIHHRKLESLIQQLDGWEDNGPLAEAFFRPLWNATLAEVDRLRVEHEAMDGLFEGFNYMFSAFKDDLRDVSALTLDYVDTHAIPMGDKGLTRNLTRGERVMLALNWGNEGNREALRNQEDLEMQDDDILDAIKSLSPEELELVNRIHAYVDSFYPDLAKAEQQATGIAPSKVEATPYEINGVQMTGGYMPLQADSSLSWRAEMNSVEERSDAMKMGGKARASSRHGSNNERVGFAGQAVNLSIDGLFKHVNGVVHDITHRKAIMDADQLLRSPELLKAITTAIGLEGYKEISQHLVRLAGGNTDPGDLSVLIRLMNYSRTVASYGAMGYSVRTALLNVTGLIPAIPEVGVKSLLGAVFNQIANPLDLGREIKSKSVAMTNRGETITRDVYSIKQRLRGNGKWTAFKAHAFWMVTKIDAFVSRAVWWAKYTNSINEGRSEADAVYDADRTVNRTQGTGMKLDLSLIEDGSPFIRAITPMYTYFNAVLNLSKRRGGKRRTGQISNAKYLSDMFWIFIMTAIVEEVMFGRSEEDETDDEMVKRYATSIAGYYMGQWFGVRELSGHLKYGQFFDTPMQSTIGAIPTAGAEIWDLTFDDDAEFDKGSMRAFTGLLPVLGMPTGLQINRMGSYLLELEEDGGDFSPQGFLITGRQKSQ